MTDIHTVNESIAVADLQKTAEIALALMMGEGGDHKRVAVKIVDDRGIESLKIIPVS